jgi:hypothetical protein
MEPDILHVPLIALSIPFVMVNWGNEFHTYCLTKGEGKGRDLTPDQD